MVVYTSINSRYPVYRIFLGTISLMASDDLDAELKLNQFCALYAFGTPVPIALKEAGYENSSIAFGFSLLRSAEAQKLVDGHREGIKGALSRSLDQILLDLDRDRELAWRCENPAAASAATWKKAELLGFLDQKNNLPKKMVITWGNDDDE
jgi:hypothetical protein